MGFFSALFFFHLIWGTVLLCDSSSGNFSFCTFYGHKFMTLVPEYYTAVQRLLFHCIFRIKILRLKETPPINSNDGHGKSLFGMVRHLRLLLNMPTGQNCVHWWHTFSQFTRDQSAPVSWQGTKDLQKLNLTLKSNTNISSTSLGKKLQPQMETCHIRDSAKTNTFPANWFLNSWFLFVHLVMKSHFASWKHHTKFMFFFFAFGGAILCRLYPIFHVSREYTLPGSFYTTSHMSSKLNAHFSFFSGSSFLRSTPTEMRHFTREWTWKWFSPSRSI